MEWRVIEAKLFTERNIKTKQKESKELGKDLEKYTRTRDFGGLRSQAELWNMTLSIVIITFLLRLVGNGTYLTGIMKCLC
jgi:hypothetical protein